MKLFLPVRDFVVGLWPYLCPVLIRIAPWVCKPSFSWPRTVLQQISNQEDVKKDLGEEEELEESKPKGLKTQEIAEDISEKEKDLFGNFFLSPVVQNPIIIWCFH